MSPKYSHNLSFWWKSSFKNPLSPCLLTMVVNISSYSYISVYGHLSLYHTSHTHEHNGIAKRHHRHIMEIGLDLPHFAGLPLSFWSHAFQTMVHLINRLPIHILNYKSPFDVLYGHSPNYTKLKPFGCLCYPWLCPYSPSKLHPRSTPCLFLGYSTDKSVYKCYNLDTYRIYHSRHVEFVTNWFPYIIFPSTKSTLPTTDEFFMLTYLPSNPLTLQTPPPLLSLPSSLHLLSQPPPSSLI